jgi:hypothetical protein
LGFSNSAIQVLQTSLPRHAFEIAWVKILEMSMSLDAVARGDGTVGFQFSLWRDGLPIDAVPQHGWLEVQSTNPEMWSP